MPRGVDRWDEANIQRRLWTPAVLQDALCLWLDATDLASLGGASGLLSQWSDKSPRGNHAAQTTGANRPALAYDQINNRPTVQFRTASSQYMTFATSGFATGNAGRAEFMLVKPVDTTTRCILSSYGAFAVTRLFDFELNGFTVDINGRHWFHTFEDGYYGNAGTVVAGSPAIYAVAYSGGGTSSSARLYTNGGSETLTFAAGLSAPNSALDTGSGSTGYLGARVDLFGYSNADIGEVLFLSRDVTAAERQNIEGYLAWKWGLAERLDASHPFRNQPPLIGA
jgi:hypothetical protein